MNYKKGLFIFRRDLRLDDNTALNQALSQCVQVIPCFIIDPRQVSKKNHYRSLNSLQFMKESLKDLEVQLKKVNARLYFCYGIAENIVAQLIKQESIDAVFVNRDYTPFSIKRDEAIKRACLSAEIFFKSTDDCLLNSPESIMTSNGTPYSIFTPYFNKARTHNVAPVHKLIGHNFYKKPIDFALGNALKKITHQKNRSLAVHGGTMQAKKILKNLKKFKNYYKEHDIPSLSTTMLSAHNKFGTISIRHVYHAIEKQLGYNHPLIRQLYWRDFFTQLAYFSPFVFGHPFKQHYEKLSWSDNKKHFHRWCKGLTGFPLVDAGMRQLNTTGFMHNRVRLIVASFLVKDLHINWLWGEQYFATQLVDYDPAVNNGNWQWCASTGADAQPYFRIFNPWLGQKKYDPHCIYIKQWVPELKNVENKIIHEWYKKSSPSLKGYPRPLIDHSQEAEHAKKMYRK